MIAMFFKGTQASLFAVAGALSFFWALEANQHLGVQALTQWLVLGLVCSDRCGSALMDMVEQERRP